MSEIARIAAAIFRHAGDKARLVVAISGPPASGKTTLAERLLDVLPAGSAAVIGLDGFHFDDAVLAARGLQGRKGAPETFDFKGFEALLKRARVAGEEVAVPVFDRSQEFSRAGASVVPAGARFVLVEGNYLMLDEDPWRQLAPQFGFSIFLDVPQEELERRLAARWLEHGKSVEEARRRLDDNDLPNVRRVLAARRTVDLVVEVHPEEVGPASMPAGGSGS